MTAYTDMLVHNARKAAPQGYKAEGLASSEATLELKIALTSNNMAGLESALYDVSTPGSSKYRKFLSKEQVRQLAWNAVSFLTQF